MSTTLAEPSIAHAAADHAPPNGCASRSAAVRLSFTWLGTRKSLTTEQKAQAADTFGAEEQYLSAGKKLLDTRHPAFQEVTGIKNRMIGLWKAVSLPYPDPGIRLIRQQRIESVQHADAGAARRTRDGRRAAGSPLRRT